MDNINDELAELFKNTLTVVDDSYKFKVKLNLSEDVYTNLKSIQYAGEIAQHVSTGIVSGGAYYLTWTTSLGIWKSLALSAGLISTPVGWIMLAGGLGFMSSVAYKKISDKVSTKIEEKTMEGIKVPKWINTPLDQLGVALSELMLFPALKIAMADGDLSELEEQYIKNYFINDWGYNSTYIDEAMNATKKVTKYKTIDDYASIIKEKSKAYVEIDYQKIIESLLSFVWEIISIDGSPNTHKQEEYLRLAQCLEEKSTLKTLKNVLKIGGKKISVCAGSMGMKTYNTAKTVGKKVQDCAIEVNYCIKDKYHFNK